MRPPSRVTTLPVPLNSPIRSPSPPTFQVESRRVKVLLDEPKPIVLAVLLLSTLFERMTVLLLAPATEPIAIAPEVMNTLASLVAIKLLKLFPAVTPPTVMPAKLLRIPPLLTTTKLLLPPVAAVMPSCKAPKLVTRPPLTRNELLLPTKVDQPPKVIWFSIPPPS
ncbi:MAG: hypothetical protein PCFJNLEI_00964 [Verrucomicrobiae bacterium]|nr:hypothetical protein [Verrucomicrobiae bacterium]